MMSYDYPHPVSRTYQYKKITKPLLERKRRARINRCLDELKDLMVDALETEGENISKLEKADILELTVRHLQRLQASRPSGLSTAAIPGEDSSESRWRSGFGHCAAEACRFLTALPGEAADRLARHLASGLQATRQLEVQVSQKGGNGSPPLSPMISRSPLVSPTLASLEKTAKLLIPSAVSPGGSSGSSTIGSPNPRHSMSPRTTLHPYCGGKTINVIDRPVGSPCQIGKEVLPGSHVGNNNNNNNNSTNNNNNNNNNNNDDNNNNNNNNDNKDIPTGSKIGRGSVEIGKEGTVVVVVEQMVTNGIPTVDKEKCDNLIGQPVADDDEEIDVENIDDSDPMWRPW